jgi:hypothetical protein
VAAGWLLAFHSPHQSSGKVRGQPPSFERIESTTPGLNTSKVICGGNRRQSPRPECSLSTSRQKWHVPHSSSITLLLRRAGGCRLLCFGEPLAH